MPDKQALEDQARRLMEEARRRSGATVEDMVRSLGDLQPRGAGTRRSWYDWHDRPETMSVLTGLAAMHLLGPKATNDLLFGTQDGVAIDPGGSVEELRQALSDATVEIARLREQVQGLVVPELEKQGELLARLLATSDTSAAETTTSTRKRGPSAASG